MRRTAMSALRRAGARASSGNVPVAMPEEDEMGRPTCCPPGLGWEELRPTEEYWLDRMAKSRTMKMHDEPGARALPKRRRKEGEAMFNTNPQGSFALDENLANEVQVFRNVNSDVIEVPVFNLKKQMTKTRKLDSYVFGASPETDMLHQAWKYELFAAKGFGGFRGISRKYAPGPAGKLRPRQRGQGDDTQAWIRDGKHQRKLSGAMRFARDWKDQRVDVPAMKQSEFLRQALSLKLNKDRLIVVEDFNFPVESVDLMRDWANSWGFDRNRFMAYVLDGGSALCPSQEVSKEVRWPATFVYGMKVAPMREITSIDMLRHHYLVVTEGALVQLNDFFADDKAAQLPPHLRRKIHVPLAELGELDEHEWATLEEEAAYETAEAELPRYAESRYLEDPWLNGQRWDANEQRIQQHRKFVSEHLPRVGEPIGADVRRYWQGRQTRLPTGHDEQPAYALPGRKDHW